jgi:putative MATE family efflux protein|tara:strand:- start:12901 stop:14292 length:1392 start_codon:yes stop_codon:yes gene_type:complete
MFWVMQSKTKSESNLTEQTINQKMITGKISQEFVRFAVPSVFGMLAISSAIVVDGIFIGNFVGAIPLASVNIVMPFITIVWGIILMFSSGSAVIAGKYLGENKPNKACDIFSKTAVIVFLAMVLLTIISFCFTEQIAVMLGAKGETVALSTDYLRVLAWFYLGFGFAVLMNFFLRIDGRPSYAFFGLLSTTIVNIFLDYIFVARFDWGLKGAALATGLAFLVGMLIVLPHFIGHYGSIKFVRPKGTWAEIPLAAFNGFSEFLTETSAGLIVLMFNWILITHIGSMGVAAFTVVDYLMYFSLLVFYGVGEGISPLISVNFGARKPSRISTFFKIGLIINLVIASLATIALLYWTEDMVNIFLNEEDAEIINLATKIVEIIWPMLIFAAVNITLTGYLTGMQCAKQSALIALARSLVLPVLLVFLFWKFFGFMYAFYALPISEVCVFIFALFLLKGRLPQELIKN